MKLSVYTDFRRVKQVISPGFEIPITPLSEEAIKGGINPDWVDGMGSIQETTSGYRCGWCGKYYQMLGYHLNASHKNEGGEPEFRKLLGIPKKYSLTTERVRQECLGRLVQRRKRNPDTFRPDYDLLKAKYKGKGVWENTGAFLDLTSPTVRNWRIACEKQLEVLLRDFVKDYGKVPTFGEFEDAYRKRFQTVLEKPILMAGREGDETTVSYPPSLTNVVRQNYGSWPDFLRHFGFTPNFRGVFSKKRPLIPEDVLPSLKSWYAVHGRLPSTDECNDRRSVPKLHSHRTYIRAFGVETTPEAMKMAAKCLGIKYEKPKSGVASVRYQERKKKVS